jgi:hypothetical protein
MEDFWKHMEAVMRWNSGLPPPRPKPSAEEITANVPAAPPGSRRHPSRLRSKHVGVRLTKRDFDLLQELASAHAVPPGTMARMLIVRGVRAAADGAKEGN